MEWKTICGDGSLRKIANRDTNGIKTAGTTPKALRLPGAARTDHDRSQYSAEGRAWKRPESGHANRSFCDATKQIPALSAYNRVGANERRGHKSLSEPKILSRSSRILTRSAGCRRLRHPGRRRRDSLATSPRFPLNFGGGVMTLADELDDAMDPAITSRPTVDQFAALIHWGTRTISRIGPERIAEVRKACHEWWGMHLTKSGWGRDAWYTLRGSIDSLLREAATKQNQTEAKK